MCSSLALLHGLLAVVGAEEELPVEELHGYHSEDEVEEQVHHQDVEHVLQGVDDAVEDGLQLGHPLDGLERTQHPQHAEGLHGAEVLCAGASTKKEEKLENYWYFVSDSGQKTHMASMIMELTAHETTVMSMTFQNSLR